MLKIFNQKGQSLIEAVVALGAAALIISAIAIAVITSVNNSDYSKYQNQATNYAQQGIEIMRSQAQSDWANFEAKTNPNSKVTYCLGQNATDLTNFTGTHCVQNIGPDPNDPFFIREITIYPPDASGIRVESAVYWIDGKCTTKDYCHMAKIDTRFADINRLPTP